MSRKNKTLGVILVILGVLFLLKSLNIFNPWEHISIWTVISKLWPSLFLILPGLMFHSSYFSGNRGNPGVLVPGGIFLVLGITFQLNVFFGLWGFTWPLYIFAVAFGLFELYIFGSREKGLLIPIGILTGLSLLFFISSSLNKILSFNTRPYALPVVLIFVGLALVLGGKGKGRA